MDRRTFLAAAAGTVGAAALARTAAAASDATVKMRDLYNKDLTFSPLAESLAGQRVSLEGFMAPPIKADAMFFVLTRRPMAVCPFCERSADWPPDIVAIYIKRTLDILPFNVPIVSRGILALGDYHDPQTGFVSRVRLDGSSYGEA